MATIKRALVSVFDKSGVVEFATGLQQEFGVELLSTGGTATALQDAGLAVTLVEEMTGSPELMDGRVKTLHPRVHAGILADRDNPEHMQQLAEHGIAPIDMVVVNLYPFEETVADPDCAFERAIEMIDIGGPCLLRAAAKNHRHVMVVSDPEAYDDCLRLLRGEESAFENEADFRQRSAAAVFAQTSMYDAVVTRWLGAQDRLPDWPWIEALYARNWGPLRYGENPHQRGELLELLDAETVVDLTTATEIGGAETAVSFNNYLDADAALGLCAELARAERAVVKRGTKSVVFIKHTNACGAAVDADPAAAYERAYLGDPNAAMGGILAVDFPVDAAFATLVMETFQRFGKPLREAGAAHAPGGFFVEVWIAPAFDEAAVAVIRGEDPSGPQKDWGRRVRLLAVGEVAAEPDEGELDLKKIAGGLLAQQRDQVGLNEDEWRVVTQRSPSEREWADLRLAWLVCKHTKSNAISLCRDGMLIGNGAGQMSRVMSSRIATWAARDNGHDERLAGAVAASDAFFPFRDGPDILAEAGVTALIQPGGSKRDDEVIAAANERGIAMVCTGTRHFRH